MAGLKIKLDQAQKPTTLARVDPEELVSGPSQFEWGETSTKVQKPKHIWVPKSFSGGPLNKPVTAQSKRDTNDVVELIDSSRGSLLEFSNLSGPQTTHDVFTQELTWLEFRTNREGECRSFRLEYYGGFNFSVPRSIAECWGMWLGKASTKLFLGDFTTEWADVVEEAESEPYMEEDQCLAVVSCGTFREGSTEAVSLDISPLNSYRGESIQGDQSEWVRQNMEAFSRQMGVSIEGCEVEAMALFTAIERRWRQPEVSRMRKSTN